jgi:hypothetical protein
MGAALVTLLSVPNEAVHLVPVEFIERKIYQIRGQKVMLDADLAGLYQVETSNLNKAVKRNLDRFPQDFMFQLVGEEVESLIFQFGISKPAGRGGRRYMPYVFTEQGVAMLSSVLKSARAIEVNIAIMRTFVRLRQYLATHQDLARKLEDVERTQQQHGDHIQHIYGCIEALAVFLHFLIGQESTATRFVLAPAFFFGSVPGKIIR